MIFTKISFRNYTYLKIFFYFASFFFIFFEAKAIGYIEAIKGEANIILDNEEIPLQELDEIFLNNKIKINDNSEVIILLDDGSTIIVKNKSELVFLEYEDIFSINPHFKIEVLEGEIIIETGELPKFKKNSTYIISPIGTLFLNGTAISAKLKENLSEVFLMTDSFGESGELILENEDGESTNIEINSGISVNDQGLNSIEITDDVINDQKNIKTVIANSAINNDLKIEKIIQKKIDSGKLTPQQAQEFKEKIILKKEKKIDQIINSSKSDTTILGEVLKNVDGEAGSKILEKIVDKNPKVTSQVLNNVIDENENLFKEITSKNNNLTEKILKTVVKEADENDLSLSKIISKTDDNISAKLITEISENKKELMIKIVSETSNLNPKKIKDIASIDEDINSKISSVIVEQLSESADATDKLKQIMLNSDADLTGEIIKQTSDLDSEIVAQATEEVLLENKEKIVEKLSSSINQGENNAFNSIIVSKAIESGETEIISKAFEMNVKTKLEDQKNDLIISGANQSSENQIFTENNQAELNVSNPNISSTELESDNPNPDNEIDEISSNILEINNLINNEAKKLKMENPEINIDKKILIEVSEVLASPN